MNKIRVSAFILTAFTAAFFSAGCGSDDDPNMLKSVHACVDVLKDGKIVKNLNGTVHITWYNLDGETKSGQNQTYTVNGIAYDASGNPVSSSGGQGGGSSEATMEVSTGTGHRCGDMPLGKEINLSTTALDSIFITGSSFDSNDDVSTADGAVGRATPTGVGYVKSSKTADVIIQFDLNHQDNVDPGKLFAKVNTQLRRMINRQPGFSATAVADRRSNPRKEESSADNGPRSSGSAAAI
jgi:hypothetical protein